ncbi:glycosyltransferase family 2 protein [Devosia sp.]|uniref:glycosyltransferase family 2 protein n=1 Tax=Devosia sp. TaxID=1871048 RepID=UPI003263F988
MTGDTIWFVIPAYNEAAQNTISTTLKTVLARYENVVVVDDCSSDATGDLALEAGAHVCRHPVNLGQGAALTTGIKYALSLGAQAIVTFDADGQHSVDDATAMLETMQTRGMDVVLGSRFRGHTEGMPVSKRLLLRAATLFTRLTTGLDVTDTHNGLRVLSRRAAEVIHMRQNRMAHASEILHQIGTAKLSFIEMPNTITYTEHSKAKGQKISGAIAIIIDLIVEKIRN